MNSKERKSIVGLVSICVLAALFVAPLLLKTNLNTENSTFLKTYAHTSTSAMI